MDSRLFVLVAAVALAGCGQSEPEAAAPLNPAGKPRDTKEAQMMAAQQQAGQKANQEAAKAAQEIAAAKARTTKP